MENPDRSFYSDHKFCADCNKYVSYLMSLDNSYCVECGGAVRLFSKADWESFQTELNERRAKGGRPGKRNQRGKESA
ncbi:MAG: hypothetical protein ABGY71_05450 [bacterium]|jgi:hypothetical protein|nr:hypothetical protein [Planctomycetota bacterium]HIL51831.1 hypothetical protein [Planctomycetota bacterium]